MTPKEPIMINSYDAPFGYRAQATIEPSSCVGCVFLSQDFDNPCSASNNQCLGVCREDQQDVIFVKDTKNDV